MKRYLIGFLKFAIPAAIIGWLLYRVPPQDFQQLQSRDKNWGLLGLAFVLALLAVVNTFVRWFLLVRALGLRFQLSDALRLGFLGYLLNFISAGSVGGDLFKAVFIAREQPGRRAEAVATVVVDRLIGLYALLVVTTVATWFVPMPDPTPEVQAICRATYIATTVGGIGLLMLLVPGFTTGSLSEWITSIPRVGPLARRLIDAVRLYRRQPGTLVVIGAQSIATHVLFAASIFCIATALFPRVPSFGDHLIIAPLSMVVAALPLAPAGFGAFEFAIAKLYEVIPAAPHDVSGILVALTFRLITIGIAAVGMVYYWTSRAEVKALQKEAAAELQQTP